MALTVSASLLDSDVLYCRGQVPCLDYGSTDPSAVPLATLQACLDQTIQYLGPAQGQNSVGLAHPSDPTIAYFEIFVPDPNGTTPFPYQPGKTWSYFWITEQGEMPLDQIGFPAACINTTDLCASCYLLGDFGDGECSSC